MRGKLLVSLLTTLLIAAAFIPLYKPVYADTETVFNAPDKMVMPTVLSSDNPNYLWMVNGSYGYYQAYFKNNSKNANAVMFLADGYNFSMDISTSQLHWYNSTYNAIIGMQQEMNPQDTALAATFYTDTINTLTYSNAWVNTDLEYRADLNQIKETLVIHAVSPPSSSIRPDYLQYVANCYYNSSLTIYAEGIGYLHPTNQQFTTTGEIDFNDNSNTTIFHLPAPEITDSTENKINGIYAVTANNGILIINIRVPKAFIDSATFPVRLDPTIFSDGFESGNFSAWTATSGTPTVSTDCAHHGTYSCQINANNEYIYKSFTSASRLNMRAYINFTSLPTSGNLAYVISLYGDGHSDPAITVQNNSGQMQWGVRDSDGTITYANATINAGVWYCVELEFGATSKTVTCYVDSNSVVSHAASVSDTVSRGVIRFESVAGEAITYYADCVVIADAYIGPESVPYSFNLPETSAVNDSPELHKGIYDTLTESITITSDLYSIKRIIVQSAESTSVTTTVISSKGLVAVLAELSEQAVASASLLAIKALHFIFSDSASVASALGLLKGIFATLTDSSVVSAASTFLKALTIAVSSGTAVSAALNIAIHVGATFIELVGSFSVGDVLRILSNVATVLSTEDVLAISVVLCIVFFACAVGVALAKKKE